MNEGEEGRKDKGCGWMIMEGGESSIVGWGDGGWWLGR